MIHLAVTVAAVLLLLSVALVFWRPLAILLVFGLLLCATVLLIALKEPHRPRGARSVTDVEAMLLICGLPRGTQAPPFKHGPTCDQWMADYRAGKIKPDWKAAR